ncbi:glycosyltransferase family 4 protein [Pseudoduganella namucuonensis]|uniref:Glycosyltransferase involved in cell wall bisynthesis n=1 Tax=Pseudoduganella namucuonensis TaxID=1035707 RepID=A0A1I7M593_9BURK|nr:glycosyltransferase family 4 protein [Pseudoduganella namucuonensis]SFV17095.1 Glycosyltransferase involved in cell wall bisynthesis [Pseudoduganella namucuonensis]
MRFLFLHQNFPGQFRHLAAHLARNPDHTVVSVGQDNAAAMRGVPLVRYAPRRAPAKTTHRYLRGIEHGILTGQAVAERLSGLKREGFTPDVIVAHPGWGDALYVKDIYPHAKLFSFCEFYYQTDGADAGFDPDFPLSVDDRARIRTRNMLHLFNLEYCDVAVSPTHWQKQVHPTAYQGRIHVIHEGVDTELARPNPAARFTLPDGRVLNSSNKVLTYVARNLEPYRGFPQFLRAVSQLQERSVDVDVLVIGGDDTSYGAKPKDALNWREKLLREIPVNPRRTHFLGKLPYREYLTALQVSSVHVYLTYPFVLSWSMLEAMSCGCLVIGSRTAPVLEVLRDGRNGLLVDFFDTAALANMIEVALNQPQRGQALRAAARETITSLYSIQFGVAQWEALIQREMGALGI